MKIIHRNGNKGAAGSKCAYCFGDSNLLKGLSEDAVAPIISVLAHLLQHAVQFGRLKEIKERGAEVTLPGNNQRRCDGELGKGNVRPQLLITLKNRGSHGICSSGEVGAVHGEVGSAERGGTPLSMDLTGCAVDVVTGLTPATGDTGSAAGGH